MAREQLSDPAVIGRSATEVLDGLFRHASFRGERAVAVSRLVLVALAVARLLLLRPQPLTENVLRTSLDCAAMLLGAAISLLNLRLTPDRGPAPRRLMLSVLADAALVFVFFLNSILWPGAEYRGLLRQHYVGLVLLAIGAAGVRLAFVPMVVGIVCNTALFQLLVGLDWLLWGARRGYGLYEIALFETLLLGAALLTWVVATRTRRLVIDAAQSLLLAERARLRLGAYVSLEVAAHALEDSVILLGGSRRPIAVLFSDLRGFTRYAEHIAPEDLVVELNDYFAAMVEVIHQHGGVVDKYMGDSIMVVFGVPLPRADDALRALRTSVAMQRALQQHNAQRQHRGLAPLRHGIGVHYGPAIAGHIGTADRLQYTVLGDVVNLANRLESATKDFDDVSVLLSAAVVRQARQHPDHVELPALRSLGAIAVRGREGAEEVFTFADDDAPR
jgi:class 3 adenylate cyclase